MKDCGLYFYFFRKIYDRIIIGDNMKKERLINIDLFKIVCIIAVIVIHVASYNAFNTEYFDLVLKNFSIINFYNMVARFCVPGFIMVSGMFLLEKKPTIKDIFRKYIFRIAVLYCIFSFLYSVIACYKSSVDILSFFFKGDYHLWYLYLIIGLYLVTPFLAKIIEDKNVTVYFLILALLFSSIIPLVQRIINIDGIKAAFSLLNVYMPVGYVGYYVAGYFFSKNKANKILYYILGLLGLISNIIIFQYTSYYNDIYNSVFLLPGTVFQSIACFLFFKDLSIKGTLVPIIGFISKHILGIYLTHIFIIKIIFHYFPTIIYKYSIISIPLVSVIVFIISFLVCIVLKKLPIFKHFL